MKGYPSKPSFAYVDGDANKPEEHAERGEAVGRSRTGQGRNVAVGGGALSPPYL